MHRQRGISLIELMIAMLIGLVITGAVIQVFLSSKATFSMQGNMSRLQENGRFALQYLAAQARPAGVGMGIRMPEEQICIVASAADPADWARLNRPVWGKRSTGAAGDLGLSGTDEVYLFSNDDCNAFLTDTEVLEPGKNANVKVTAYCPSMRQNQVVMIADMEKAVLIRITNSPAANAPNPTLAHSAGTNSKTAECGGFKFSDITFQSPARVIGFEHKAFYVAATARNGSNGQPVRALFVRDTVSGVAEEVVEGVEAMRVRYGVALAGRDAVQQYMTAAEVEAANRWGDVRTLGFELLLVADGKTSGAEAQSLTFDGAAVVADGRLRQVYRTVVALRNRIE
ncbi:PilW family protein [Pseudomonas sp.]|uniref:PilW family protein n=1 Tax=Pseudomonas sp. TaxID=306 RepID=UPI002733F065|nr:PilW family protein [Pseudomonas sp.]MDP3813569.1 PilW family protein [Pseudomonas sp.]